ncbi:MAG: T9SS type A sorting domain-containing protein [Bacteroidia bacterium]|nr:T9SS type A sorting domain-containing protein [Bacteroidia bacterium]
MKKFLLIFSCVLGFALSVQGQCVPNTTYTSPGIYPDTLADGCQGQAYAGVVDFVFPADTTVATPFGPVLVPFDSFLVSAVNNIPAGLNYACNISNCHYVTVSGQLTRGCVDVSGTPTDTTAYTDSIEVIGDAYITVFGQPTSFSSTFKLGLKIHPAGSANCGVGIDESLQSSTQMTVYPNPIEDGSMVSYKLGQAADVKLEVYSVTGKKVQDIYNGYQPAGEHSVKLFDGTLPAGLFFVKLTLNNGSAVITQKVLSVY